MNGSLFDHWTQSLAGGVSRRIAVKALGGLLAVGLGRLGAPGIVEDAEAVCLPGESCNCTPVGAGCSRDGQCCSDLCLNNGTCGCGSIGASCAKDKNCCAGATCDRGACVPITDYAFLRAWNTPYVTAVAVDAASRVYANAEMHGYEVHTFTSHGDVLASWGSTGNGDGEFEVACGIAVDRAAPAPGRVYVTDTYNFRVQVFTTDGDFVFAWGGTQGGGAGEFEEACGVAVDAQRFIYVVDWGEGNHRVQKFNQRGGLVTSWGGFGGGNGEFEYPRGIATHGSKVYVVDGGNDRVQQFSTNGAFQLKWGGSGSGNGKFTAPAGVATDQAGNVYVSDRLNHRIQKFTDGVYVAKWGSKGSGDGQFNEPHGIAVDLSGRVYVADWGNHRIQVFKPV